MLRRSINLIVFIFCLFLALNLTAQPKKALPLSEEDATATPYEDEEDEEDIELDETEDQSWQQMVEDKEPPQIIFTPVTKGVANKRVEIKAQITDNKEVRVAKLFYRQSDSGKINPGIPLVPIEPGSAVYQATLPVQNKDIIYYIEAVDSDGNGPVQVGPYRLVVSKTAAKAAAAAGLSTSAQRKKAATPNYFILVLLVLALGGIIASVIILVLKNKPPKE